MALKAAAVRVIASACLTRYDAGEREITDIVNSYTALSEEDRNAVLAQIYTKRPELAPQETTETTTDETASAE